jgi:hypothetical protein
VEGTLGAAKGNCFREQLHAAALQGASRSSDRGGPGELILLGFRKKSSEGLVSGRLLFAHIFQSAGDIGERQKVSGSIGLG